MTIDQSRIDYLRNSIREGEGRLSNSKQAEKIAIRRAIANAQIRIDRLLQGLPEGGMIWDGEQWVYEFEQAIN